MRLSLVVGAILLASCGGQTSKQAHELSTPAAVEDIRSMQYNPSTGRYDVICRDGTTESVTADDIRSNYVCRRGGGGNPGGGNPGGGNPGGGTAVSFYHSDSCSGDLLATVNFSYNSDWNEARCQSLSTTINQNVWGVRFDNGTCADISDMAFSSACRLFQAGPNSSRNSVRYYHSDTCSGDLIASLNFTGDYYADKLTCDNASRFTSVNVWGVQYGNGACRNISDMPFSSACPLFQGDQPSNGSRVVEFFRSDTCSSDLIGTVSFGFDPNANQRRCQELARGVSTNVWAVRSDRGVCEDISDTSFLNACLRFQ